MSIKKMILTSFLMFLLLSSLYAQMKINNSLFNFDRKVNNDFINNYTPTYTEYFNYLYSLDCARDKNSEIVYGCATEKYYNIIYYFDEKQNSKIFGYASDKRRTFIRDAGKVAVTSTGKIYVEDCDNQSIYYWDRKKEAYEPEGKLKRRFNRIGDICKDPYDNLFILDDQRLKVYKYDTNANQWQTFPSGKDYLPLKDFYEYEWALPIGLYVNSNGIYIAYIGGVIVRYNLDGEYVNHFKINISNLGLFASPTGRTETILSSITGDSYGNIYISDVKAEKIHVFNQALDYLCSWNDPAHPIEGYIADISFVPGTNNFFILYSWGFYSYKLNNKQAVVTIDRDFIYPDYAGGEYKGIKIEAAAIKSGVLDVALATQGGETKIIDRQYLSQVEGFHYAWDGRDRSGDIVPYGEYGLKFYFDDEFLKEIPISVKAPPQLTVLDGEGKIINNTTSSLEYGYIVLDEGVLTISVSKLGDDSTFQWEEVIYESDVNSGQYKQFIHSTLNNQELVDGYYRVNFKIRPPELRDYNIQPTVKSRTFAVDKQLLQIGEIVNQGMGINPYNPALAEMQAHFSLSEGAYVTADVYNVDNQLIRTLCTGRYLAEGQHGVKWDGRNTGSMVATDSRYRFVISAEQEFLGTSLKRSGDPFVLDTTAPKIAFFDAQDVYYISPDEPSSVGIKDECSVGFAFNEQAEVAAAVWDKEGVSIKSLTSSLGLGAGQQAYLSWDGRSNIGAVVLDGRYRLRIESQDSFGNAVANWIPIYVDNNQLEDQGQEQEQLLGYEEFRVNSCTELHRRSSAITKTDSGFVITWASDEGYSEGYGIYAQRYDHKGNPIGDEFQVYKYPSTRFSNLAITKTDTGFIITWEASSFYLGYEWNHRVFAKRYDTNGNPIGSIFKVSMSSGVFMPVITQINSGFIITWVHGPARVYAQRYDQDGNSLGEVLQVSTNTSRYHYYPAIARTDTGLVITWSSRDQDGSSHRIHARLYDQDGNPLGDEFQVNTYTANDQWRSGIVQSNTGFVIVWESNAQDGSGWGIYARRYDHDGNPLGEEFRINNTTEGDQAHPAIARINNGFLIVWDAPGEDGKKRIYGRRYDHEGNPLGEEFIVAPYFDYPQSSPAISDTDNGFVTAYQAFEGTGWGIYAKRYETYTLPSGSNLTAQMLFPLNDRYTTKENFGIKAMVSDAYIDRYQLNLIDNQVVTPLVAEQGRNVTGELSILNILSLEKGPYYTVQLEAWDKAGNYREDSFMVRRGWDSQEFIDRFGIDKHYNAAADPPRVHFKLKESADVSFELLDEAHINVRNFDLGLQPGTPVDYLLDITGLADGDYRLIINVDSATHGHFESLLKFKIDNQSPVLQLADFGAYFSSQTDVVIPASLEEAHLKGFSLSLLDGQNQVVKLIKEGKAAADLADLTFSPLSVGEGGYTLVFEAEDLAGNTAAVNYGLIVDRTKPVFHLTAPAFNAVLSGSEAVQGTITDAWGVADYDVFLTRETQPDHLLFGGTGSQIDHTWDSASQGQAILVGGLKFVAHDRAGNMTTLEKPIVVDNHPPAVEPAFESAPVTISGKPFINGTNKLYLMAISGDSYSAVQEIFYKINEGSWLAYSEALTLEAEGHYQVGYYGVDNHGNTGAAGYSSFFIDATDPDFTVTISDPKYVSGGNTYVPLENNITIAGSDGSSAFASGIEAVEYRAEGGLWQDYGTEGVRIYREGPTEVSVRVTDRVGNVTERSIGTVIVDIAPPQTVLETQGKHYYSYQRNLIALSEAGNLKLSAVDLGFTGYVSGVKKTYFSVDGVLQEYGGAFSVPEDKISDFHFFSVDKVDNTEQRATLQIAVDREPPEVELLSENPVYLSDGVIYSRGDNRFKLSAEDNYAGVKDIFYRLNGQAFQAYRAALQFEEEMDGLLSYYAEDYLELASEVTEQRLVIDNTPPHSIMVSSRPLIEIDGRLYADSRYEFSWLAQDGASGVSEIVVRIDGLAWDPTGPPFQFTEDGDHLIEYYSLDNVGNAEEKKSVAITTPIPDRTPPISKIIPTYSPYHAGSMDYFRSDVAFTIESEDILGANESYASGVEVVYCAINGAAEQVYYGQPLTFTDEGLHEIRYYAVDKAGNIEQYKLYLFTIDNSPPESELMIQDNKNLIIEDWLYLSESDRVVIQATDIHCGVQSLYYRLDGNEDWLQYTEPFTLPDGKHTVEYYAVDHLGNSEPANAARLWVVTDYNIISYKTAAVSTKSRSIKGYAVNDGFIAYLRGSDRKNHIYLQQLDPESRNLFRGGAKLSRWPGERKEIALGSDYLAAVELRDMSENIYLYKTSEPRQAGQQLSFSGVNTHPLILGTRVYWISREGGINRIQEYEIDQGTWNTVFAAEQALKLLKTADKRLMFLLDGPETQQIYAYHQDEPVLWYTRSIQAEEDRILSFSVYENLLATEVIKENEKTIELYRIDNNQAELLIAFTGRTPLLVRNALYYTQKRDAQGQDSREIFTYYDLANAVHSSLLAGEEIEQVLIDAAGNLFLQREPISVRSDDDDDEDEEDDDDEDEEDEDEWEEGRIQVVFLKNVERESLVDDIAYSFAQSAFAYNSYADVEDFIYADQDLTFPRALNRLKGIHHIQSFDSRKGNTDENYLTFKAEKPLGIILIAEQSLESQSLPDAGFERLRGEELRELTAAVLRSIVRRPGRFDIWYIEIPEGDTFTLKGLGGEQFTPLIFLGEPDKIKWPKDDDDDDDDEDEEDDD